MELYIVSFAKKKYHLHREDGTYLSPRQLWYDHQHELVDMDKNYDLFKETILSLVNS